MATVATPAVTGPAHVAVVSFLAARAAPTGGFWVALAGGVALARVAERRGARSGFGASAAAMLETVAILGPARFGVPLTQAISAPMLGRLHARGAGFWPRLCACAVVRLAHNTATTAFFIWVIAGGLDAYAGTYDALGRRLGLEVGTADALGLTLAGLLAWAAFASTVQVLVYARGLRRWAAAGHESSQRAEPPAPAADPSRTRTGRFDPRAVCVAAVIAFVLLLTSTSWVLLAALAAWLAVVWAIARATWEPVPAGLVFAAVLAGGAFAFALAGGLGLDIALRRASRAALLVLVATWLRSAAGAAGLRTVTRRVLGRLRAIPAAREAAAVLDGLSTEGRLAAAGRSLAERVGRGSKRPLALLDSVLGWVIREASAFGPAAPAPAPTAPAPAPPSLSARAANRALIATALLPAVAHLVHAGGA